MVVVAAQVAKPDVTQVGRVVVGQKFSGLPVAEVPRAGSDALLQVVGVTSFVQELLIVVAFNDQVIGLAHVMSYLVGDGTHVRGQRERLIAKLEEVSRVVDAVVRYVERGDLEIFDLERSSLFNINGGAIQAVAYHWTVRDAPVYFLCGVNRDMHLLAQVTGRLDMVVMVVRDQDGHDRG